MHPQTSGLCLNKIKTVPIKCKKNDSLDDLKIKGSCFLLIIISEGSALFRTKTTTFEAVAPCFVCFDETEDPQLLSTNGLRCDSIYFNPTFLNVNMTFERLRSQRYEQLALVHDMFLLKPFTSSARYVFPLFDEYSEKIKSLFFCLDDELENQSDWYWSCRCRSFFIEIMLLLERAYGLVGSESEQDITERIQDRHLKRAVIYIDGNYHLNITVESIAKAAFINHSTLTKLFKSELGMTPIEYLWYHRLFVAKRFLEFTALPIKDIAERCGFKTAQHFSRKFEAAVGKTPRDFRVSSVAKRKKAF